MRTHFLLLLLSVPPVVSLVAADHASIPVTAPPQTSGPGERDTWRRTKYGWEDRRRWKATGQARLPRSTAIHPSLIAGLQLLVSLAALIALSNSPHPNRVD